MRERLAFCGEMRGNLEIASLHIIYFWLVKCLGGGHYYTGQFRAANLSQGSD